MSAEEIVRHETALGLPSDVRTPIDQTESPPT
jgi:hypothetical protein